METEEYGRGTLTVQTKEFRETGHSSLAEFRTEPSREMHTALVIGGNHCGSQRNRELPFRPAGAAAVSDRSEGGTVFCLL